MALRCASVGACEDAGVAPAIIAIASDAQSAAVPLNVPVIEEILIVVAGVAASTEVKFECPDREIFAGNIIFSFKFHCKHIVAIDGRLKPSSEQRLRGREMK
jgi:hypothetical protein